jgi:hypothetical protein
VVKVKSTTNPFDDEVVAIDSAEVVQSGLKYYNTANVMHILLEQFFGIKMIV